MAFGRLSEEVERLQRLSLSLDVLAEPVAGRPPREDLDLSAAIRSAVELAGPGFERAGVRVEVDVPARLPAAAVPDHLSQVLGNLLQNAQRYAAAGGTVTVGARPVPGRSVAGPGRGGRRHRAGAYPAVRPGHPNFHRLGCRQA